MKASQRTKRAAVILNPPALFKGVLEVKLVAMGGGADKYMARTGFDTGPTGEVVADTGKTPPAPDDACLASSAAATSA